MILKNDFYTVVQQKVSENAADFRIKLNSKHIIYLAHFQNNPITPGVCLLQIVVELFGMLQGKSFSIKTLKNVKFTAPISPTEFPEVDFSMQYDCEEDRWNIKATVAERDTVFSKISMTLI